MEALQNNYLAKDSVLYIFSDGSKYGSDLNEIKIIRNYLSTISGFKKIFVVESAYNKGLANSIIEGVSNVISEFGSVIVVEDDLITSPNFLNFSNQALEFYKNKKEVFSVAGYTAPIKNAQSDVYFTKRASSWGWATWKDRWEQIDWTLNSYENIVSKSEFKNQFNKMGSDMFKMLRDYESGKINSWAIRWCLHQFIQESFTVYPTISKVKNIGTGLNASHTQDRFNRFYTPLDDGVNEKFYFEENVKIDKFYLSQFLKQFSFSTRIKYKILNLF